MYTAEDIKRRIKELRQNRIKMQMQLVEEATNYMYENGEASADFISEYILEDEVKDVIEKAGFKFKYLGEKSYCLYIETED